jgi:multidrug efflux pump subunit AcrB
MFGMAHLGLSIDMITMVALLIAIGILVDDAIVIAENIASHYHAGKGRLAAVVDGAREVAPGVLASFATTVLVFGPLAFISGDIGSILKVLPIVLILTLTFSLIEAFMILPNHLSHSLSDRENYGDRLRTRVNDGTMWLRDRVAGPLVDAAVEWRYLTLGVAIMILLVSLSMIAGGTLKFRAFPDLDGDVIQARILMPQGTPLVRTEAVVTVPMWRRSASIC